MREHARLLCAFFGEHHGMTQLRKFTGWYLKGFPGAKRQLGALHMVKTMAEFEELLLPLSDHTPYPLASLRARRCKSGRAQDQVALPEGFLDARDDDICLADPMEMDGG